MKLILFLILCITCMGFKQYSSNFKQYYSNKLMTRLNAYCVNVNLYIKPDRRDEFLQCIKQNAKGSNTNEPKCRMYIYGESTTTRNTFHFQEIYDDEDGFKQHQARYY